MDSDTDKRKDNEDKKGIFFGIIGVLTLIVAIIGASFAYFSINARSETDALTVNAASVQIVYEHGNKLEIKDLIPSSKDIAAKTVTRYLQDREGGHELCKDDNDRTVCGVYEFTLTNNGDASVNFTAKVEPTPLATGPEPPKETGFENLKFVMYDITSAGDTETGSQIYEGTFGYEEFGLFDQEQTSTQTIDGGGTEKKYRLFVWLNEAGEANNKEQGAVFKGTVTIDVIGASNGNLTGVVND